MSADWPYSDHPNTQLLYSLSITLQTLLTTIRYLSLSFTYQLCPFKLCWQGVVARREWQVLAPILKTVSEALPKPIVVAMRCVFVVFSRFVFNCFAFGVPQ